MLTVVFLVCLLIWVPILFYHIERHSLQVLLVWLFIAPIATNLVILPNSNPFFNIRGKGETSWRATPKEIKYTEIPTANLTLRGMLEPNRILLSLFIVVFILRSSLNTKRWTAMDGTEIWMCIFSIILVASSLFYSIRTVFGLRTALDAFIIPFLGYFFARRLVLQEESLRKLVQATGYMGSYLIILCLLEYVLHRDLFYRVAGPYRSINLLYVAISVIFFITVLDLVQKNDPQTNKRYFPWWIRYFILFSAPVIILLTWTRGEWLGFMLAVVIFVFLGRRLISHRFKLAMVGAGLLLLMIIAIATSQLPTKELASGRIGQATNVYGRFATWLVGIQAGIEHPIFGIGLNDSRAFLERRNQQLKGVRSYTTLHNSLLSIFVELGSIGLLAFLGIIVSIIRMALTLYRRGRHLRDQWRGVVIIAIMVAYLVDALFALTLYLSYGSQIYVYACIGGIAGLYSQNTRHQSDWLVDHPTQQVTTAARPPKQKSFVHL